MKRIIVLMFCLISVLGYAQTGETIKWSFSLSSKEIHLGDTLEVIATAEIIPDWYLYSSDFDPSLGPTVTSFDFSSNKSYSLLGKIKAIKPKKKFDPIWDGEVTYFVGHAEFRQKIVIQSTTPKISLVVNYQTCSDALGRCIPGEADFEFTGLNILPAKKTVKTSAIDIPNTNPEIKGTESVKTTEKPSLKSLESEKEKLIQRDSKGNDVSVDYLKSFVKKYSK